MAHLLQHKTIGLMKPTHGHQPSKMTGEIGPVDVLIDRSQQWKHIAKSLLNYYKGLSSIEKTAAKSTLGLMETIQVPFHEGHHFLGEGGWQEVLYEVRDKTRILAEQHTTLAQTLDKTVVTEFEVSTNLTCRLIFTTVLIFVANIQSVRSELKARILAIEKEAGVLAAELEKERALGAQYMGNLQTGIETFESSEQHMMAKDDPVITHAQTLSQLIKLVHKENALQTSLIKFQQEQPSFEEKIATSIQSACKLYDEAKAFQLTGMERVQKEIADTLQRVQPSAEYEFYASQEGSLMDPNTPYRTVEAISFPGLNHPATIPMREGPMERKKRFTKAYKEAYYVLSPSGYLHERRSSDENAIKPIFSLFLPECSLGSPSQATSKSHKFLVEGNKAIKSTIEGKLKSSLRFGGKEIAYAFRARTHVDMTAWWNEVEKLARDSKGPSATPAFVRSGKPVAPNISSALANVGYSPQEARNRASSPTSSPVERSASGSTEETVQENDDGSSIEEGGSSGDEAEHAKSKENSDAPAPITSIPATSEGLPGYTGDGTSHAEKGALHEKPGLLGALFGSSPAASASTST
ncbi:hypothetical protein P7C70_g5972, partial [Phenoliferia sp. Uapishka_3]